MLPCRNCSVLAATLARSRARRPRSQACRRHSVDMGKAAHAARRTRRFGRAFEPSGEPLTTVDVTTLRGRVELARSHIFEHPLTQRTDSVGFAHGELHPEDHDTSILRTGFPSGYDVLSIGHRPLGSRSAQRAGAQRLRALAHRASRPVVATRRHDGPIWPFRPDQGRIRIWPACELFVDDNQCRLSEELRTRLIAVRSFASSRAGPQRPCGRAKQRVSE
jgi:hypothetical protein